ncbi:hypothetical protein BFP72_13815 [Reichenbachiella sp. 5M10]|uniref:hypothetical protein n=1 Tax=Reichenbachiella sp. 5M10 TaxID=1889772 RepID=UPI000C1601FD|nr:hypothetical protein [Reichenbachiella sp. 5M10]PIB36396.1 hypothetical protein BFP72_13815 [Reichenbachiella sp. 5M10]
MKRICSVLVIMVMTVGVSLAQSKGGYTIEGDRGGREGNGEWMEKVYVGGGVAGLSFSERITSIGFTVIGGYRWTDRLNTGIGMSYQYFEDKYYDDKYNVFGPQAFAQYQIYGPIFGMVLYEYNVLNYNGRNYNYDGLFLGAGYSQNLGGKAVVNFYLLYNVLYEQDNREDGYSSPYSIGVNFMVGF